MNVLSGNVVSPNEALEIAREHGEGAVARLEVITDVLKNSSRYYSWRNATTVAGLLLLVAARLVASWHLS